MTELERHEVMEKLAESHLQLAMVVRPLTHAQWVFHESTDRWSTAEIVEHLTLFEGSMNETIASTLTRPAQPAEQILAANKDLWVMSLPDSRVIQIEAHSTVWPTGQSTDKLASLKKLDDLRTKTLAFATMTEAPLHDHLFQHEIFGHLNCRQWLLLLSQHTVRHIRQIEDIQKDPAYPAE